jgi:hypothetical protein
MNNAREFRTPGAAGGQGDEVLGGPPAMDEAAALRDALEKGRSGPNGMQLMLQMAESPADLPGSDAVRDLVRRAKERREQMQNSGVRTGEEITLWLAFQVLELLGPAYTDMSAGELALLLETGGLSSVFAQGELAGYVTVNSGFLSRRAAGGGSKLLKANNLDHLSTEAQRTVRNLERRLTEHREKLDAFRRNPDAFDDKGFLKNAPSAEVRERIIQGRIRHLENEIANFETWIRRTMDGG